MTLKQLWMAIRTTWQSRPFAIILPICALIWYWYSHGHLLILRTAGHGGSLPPWTDLITMTALLTAKWERITDLFFGSSPPAGVPPTPPAVVSPIIDLKKED